MGHSARGGPTGRLRRPSRPACAAHRSVGGSRTPSVVDELAASTYAMGELMLEAVPGCLSDAANVRTPLCAAIGESLANGLAVHRYALSGDHRALQGLPHGAL